MKLAITLMILTFSLSALACPDLSGTYEDRNQESVVIALNGCSEVTILSRQLSHTLLLDNVFTVVEDNNDLTATGRGIFVDDILVLEARVSYKKNPGIPKILLPVRAVSKYIQTPTGDLEELLVIYNWFDKVLKTTKTIYKRVAY